MVLLFGLKKNVQHGLVFLHGFNQEHYIAYSMQDWIILVFMHECLVGPQSIQLGFNLIYYYHGVSKGVGCRANIIKEINTIFVEICM